MPKKNEAQVNSELADWVDDYFNENEVLINLSKIKKPEQLAARARISEIKNNANAAKQVQHTSNKKEGTLEIAPTEPTIREMPENKLSASAVNNKNERTEDANKAAICKHHFGYLKMKSKDQQIPEECIVCLHSIECMLGTNR